MTRRSLLSRNTRETLFGIPTRLDELVQHYLLSSADLELIRTRRRAENQFGLAVHIALLRHPGQGWQDGVALPIAFLSWLGDQLMPWLVHRSWGGIPSPRLMLKSDGRNF